MRGEDFDILRAGQPSGANASPNADIHRLAMRLFWRDSGRRRTTKGGGRTMKKTTTTAKKATAAKKKSASKAGPAAASPSRLIDERIAALGDWRGQTLARVRALIRQVDPQVTETWKWRGVPVWEHDGIICTGETYKTAVKLTFAKGAALDDPAGLFNSSLEGNVRRRALGEGQLHGGFVGLARA